MPDLHIGSLFLLNDGSILGQVTAVHPNGYQFDCLNGAWSGFHDVEAKTVTIDGENNPIGYEGRITHTHQPPKGVWHYNDRIAWMKGHPDF